MPDVAVVMMLGREGTSPAEQWVARGRTAAARDALRSLRSIPEIGRIVVASPDSAWAAWQADLDYIHDPDRPGEAFRFGPRLAELCERHQLQRFLYLGGGSVPLLTVDQLADAVRAVAAAEAPLAITNNVHSSDWLAASTAEPIVRLAQRLPRDNSLGWVLRTEAGMEVRGLPASAGTRVDIDTPFDLALLSLYPGLGGELGEFLAAAAASPATARLRAAVEVLATPGSQLALIGRVASAAWGHLEANTQVWLRVYSEERGMAASGRQSAGQVRSLVAAYLDAIGPEAFFRELAGLAQSALIDTRLLLAHHRLWPRASDRYASDLGEWRAIEEPWLRQFTRAAVEAGLPAVLGGHGVIAGGLYALVDILKSRG
jgi:hypothetical protein